ncbi:unnamed protein product [Parajaminaea phylloscopi]
MFAASKGVAGAGRTRLEVSGSSRVRGSLMQSPWTPAGLKARLDDERGWQVPPKIVRGRSAPLRARPTSEGSDVGLSAVKGGVARAQRK